ALTIPASLAGLPAVSIPVGKIFEIGKGVPPTPQKLARSQARELGGIVNLDSSINGKKSDKNYDYKNQGNCLPVGMQIICDKGNDGFMLEIAERFES
ncbi:MAG: hypothetical protein Q7S39_04110, partial [Ignavibacteria bacterium]|nr:hypothetical protein [Ignavibacteria bacterium]